MRVEIINEMVRVRGSFQELARLKSFILNYAESNINFSQSKDFIELSLNSYLAIDKKNDFVFEHDVDSELILGKLARKYETHALARDEVYRKYRASDCITGSDHWDKLLDPHQGLAANCMATDGLLGMCIFDEQGTGKTITTLAAFDLLKQQKSIDSIVIVAPKTLVQNWNDEINKFFTHWTPSIYVATGNRAERFRKINSSYDFYLLTYETLITDLESYKSVARTKKLALVADESFYVKNPDANRSAAIMSLRRLCQKCFVLCGTPAPNRPSDLIHQFTLADDGYSFGDNVTDNSSKFDDVELIDKIIETRGVYLRRTKKSVLPDLPAKNFNIVELKLEPKQQLLYNEAKAELILYLKSLDNISFKRNLATYFQKRNALLQICVDPSLIDPLYNELPCKFKYLKTKLDDLIINEGHKVVIWSVYTKTIDRLFDEFSNFNPARIDGKIANAIDRKLMVDKFQTDDSCKIFIGNPAAAGAGITLHRSSIAVYISYSNQAAHYMQSLDRIHRRGQSSSVVDYYFIIAQNTIESKEVKRLIEKQECQNSLLGDSEQEVLELSKVISELENV